MNVIVRGISMPLSHTPEALADAAAKRCGAPVTDLRILRRSVDARKKTDVHFVYHVQVTLAHRPRHFSDTVTPAAPEHTETILPWTAQGQPLVAGAGPAGLFAALTLAKAGARPLIVERGQPVEQRSRDVAAFFAGGDLDPASNIQFGEGGAGAFSDGKLTSGISDTRALTVLRTLVQAGAPEEILWEARPHIGTDRLPAAVAGLRREIERLGGRFLYGTRLKALILREGRAVGALLDHNGAETEVSCAGIVLAPGHSARDTFETLLSQGVTIVPKPFSVGVRAEHLQRRIDEAQYGPFAGHPALGAADYKLACHLPSGRGVYTFCMFPGGCVVAAASEPLGVVTNGMSAFARDGENANAAVLVSVGPDDFPSDHPLAGIAFQRAIEQAAYRRTGSYLAPAQRLGDFLAGLPSSSFGTVRPSYRPGVVPCDLSDLFPAYVTRSLQAGFADFDRRLRGFADPDAVLTAPETRSSSPVRILRDERCESVSTPGLYPCGEGAGYAGGILSAAVDGIRCAESVIGREGA